MRIKNHLMRSCGNLGTIVHDMTAISVSMLLCIIIINKKKKKKNKTKKKKKKREKKN